MRFHVIFRYMGLVMLLVSAFMLVSAFISAVSGFDSSFYPLLLSSLLTALLGAFPMLFAEKSNDVNIKESYCIVVGSWLLACLVGTFPYLIWGGEFNFVNAWFESVSGFTTTGASVLTDIEVLPRGLLFWRSSSTWLGGVGVVMFALVILPSLGKNKMALSNVELSTIAKDNYRYRTHIIVQILVVVYLGLTLISTLLLKLAGMNWFDSVNHAMSAAATSGFSTKNTSIAFYNNPYIELVLMFTMTVAGIHFGLIYATIVGKANNIFKAEVTRAYFVIIAVCSLVIALSIYMANVYPTFLTSLRYSSFQVISLISTTGYATADTNFWTPLSMILLIFVSIVCACAGSTAGGIKVDRLLLSVKMLAAKVKQQQHPNAVIRIRINGLMQETDVLYKVSLFVVAYLLLILFGTIFATCFQMDLFSSFSSSVACLGNVGPGFGSVGSMNNYSTVPAVVKMMDTFLMLLGRLEIFGLIQLFFIKWWR